MLPIAPHSTGILMDSPSEAQLSADTVGLMRTKPHSVNTRLFIDGSIVAIMVDGH